MTTPINKILLNQIQNLSNDELANVSASLSAILGQGGGGGGEPCASAWRPTVTNEGVLSWTLTTSTTTPTPVNITGPQGPAGTSGAKGDDATPITATADAVAGGTQVTINYTSGGDPLAQFTVLSGEKGADGTNGTDGKDGANGISPTFTITPTAGGTHVVLSGAQGEESFDVLSGAAGANGQKGTDGISPTFTTSVTSDEQHPQGGTHVVISGAAGESAFNVWNGVDGTGASVNLFGNNGVSVTKDGTNYTVGLSGGYYSDTLSAYSAMYAGSANKASEAQGFRWGDNTYQDTSAALTNLWNSKNHVTLQTADNILTVDNNDNTSATLSAMSYISNTAHGGWLPQRSCVCQDSEIYGMSQLADGQGMLFFVVSAH